MKKRYINPTILCVEMQDNLMLDLSKIEAKGQTKDETIPKGGGRRKRILQKSSKGLAQSQTTFLYGTTKVSQAL